jgi:hypothetical protein
VVVRRHAREPARDGSGAHYSELFRHSRAGLRTANDVWLTGQSIE